MEKITKEELKTILEQHKLWLNSNGKEGKCANLTGANLSGADLYGAILSGANLTDANLTGANLIGADLTGANLSGADLTDAKLYGANLTDANLTGANLTGVDLIGADLIGADLTGADLIGADLRHAVLYYAVLTGANLSDANLYGADLELAILTDTILDEKEQCRKGIVLTEPMVGYKKARGGKIITLEIPIGSKVFSINNNKRRTNKVNVIDMQGEAELSSWHNTDFKYHVGDEIEISDFNERYNVECGAGIHFFLTRKEAKNFKY